MLRFLLSILFSIFLINKNYAAREGTGYNRGLNNKNISTINDLLDNQNYKKSIKVFSEIIHRNLSIYFKGTLDQLKLTF